MNTELDNAFLNVESDNIALVTNNVIDPREYLRDKNVFANLKTAKINHVSFLSKTYDIIPLIIQQTAQ